MTLKDETLIRRFRRWLEGQRDRHNDQPCKSANGDYLDGWYAPEATHPQWLTSIQAARLRRMMDE